ncbi:Vmc-like lipoprotein signal peptide domain-containing protein [Metamycoplasma sualvi]|uniref:Vmc-like lipoprotein signal peptide domain-containing protein n=1 Tax=Metamycoplasma sualvi TaxID=2125 RepID=UPI0038731704
MNKKLFIMNKKLLMGLGSALILSTPILVVTSCGDNGNEAQDIKISSVTSKIEQDKVVVTVTGSKLPTDISKWKFKENNTVSSEWSLSSSQPATETQVTFAATYANVIGKTFTIEGTGAESNASTEFTVPVSTISNINSDMTDEGNLVLTVTGNNLSSTNSLYVFNFVQAAPSTYTNTNPSIDVNQISLTWENSSQIIFTIVKESQGQVLTKDLYGAKFSLQIKDQTPATEFTFSDYIAPTAINKDQFFTNVHEGTSDSSINTSVTSDKITGDNLAYTITTSAANNKFVSIVLPTTNISSFLSGQKGFTTSGNSTTLTWSIQNDQTNNWEYDASSSTLKNKNELTTSGFTVVMIGTLQDTLTNVTKTFELSLTIKMIDNPVQTISSATSEITENGDLKILLTGSNLPQEVTKYKFTYSGSETNVPTVDSTKLELDTTYNNTNTSVQFIIKKIKDTTPSAPSNYASSTSPTTPPLPIAQTKGLYGKEFSVTLVDVASNPSSRVEGQPVTFTFADYVAPTSIESSKFFENADSYKQKVTSLQKEGKGSLQQLDYSPLTKEDISQEDASKPFEWTITSHYKSHTYIYLVLPSQEEILASIGGWKGFSENLPSSPQSPQYTYTSVSWEFKGGTDHTKFEELGNGNVLHNKEALTENAPISADLTATITDRLTNKSLSFDIKITFKLGALGEPTIDNNATPTPTLSDNNTNVKVTIKGTNLPTDIAKWKIEESNVVSSQQPKEAGDTSNSIWTINTSNASSTSIEFSAKYSDVAGKKYNFSLVGYSTVTTSVTCPSPKFTNSQVKGQFANRYNIEFTLSGTDLPGDINMYKFGKVTVDGSQEVSLDDLQKTINFVSGTEVKITFNKYKNNEITDRTVQTKGLYGKEASIWFSNEAQSNTNKISFPSYEISGMNKEILGTIYTGSNSDNLTPQTNNLGIDIKTMSNNNEYQVTITTDSDTAKFIKFELPSHSIDSSETDVTGRANGLNFLETGFNSWGGFTGSLYTSLTWSISTQTPPSTNGSESSGGSREGNDGTSTETNGWKLDGNVLTNSSALTTQGSNVVLTATLTDSETGETVSLKVNLTVKLKTSSSTGIGSRETTPGESNNF